MLALQRTAGNRAVQRLVEDYAGDPPDKVGGKPAGSQSIVIDALSEADAYAHYQRLRTHLGVSLPLVAAVVIKKGKTTWTYEPGDDTALEAQQATTAGTTKAAFVANLAGDSSERDYRNIAPSLNELVALVEQLAAGQPQLTSFRDWMLTNANKLTSPEQRFNALNELREAKRRLAALGPGQELDLSESLIPGTAHTADLLYGAPAAAAGGPRPPGTQVEVKTVRAPVTTSVELSKELGQACTKYRNAGAQRAPGAAFHVVIYGSYAEELFKDPGAKTTQGTVKMPNRSREVTLTPNHGPERKFDFFAHILKHLQTKGFVGADQVDRIDIRMENGPSFGASRAGTQWTES